MGKRMPPVPPANRSPKGNLTSAQPNAADDKTKLAKHDDRTRNLEQQGRQGNIAQNTTHQGLQQDR